MTPLMVREPLEAYRYVASSDLVDAFASVLSGVPRYGVGMHFLSDLGWTEEEARDARMRLASFEEDWNAPGMEEYDHL